jgi:hypothetical protein
MSSGKAKWTCISVFLLAVAGCGGGKGNDAVGNPFENIASMKPPGGFEGAWHGTDANQYERIDVVLENSDIWSFYGTGPSPSILAGFLRGQGHNTALQTGL